MDDFGDKLNAILNDPAALSRIGELAKSVMGGDQETKGEEPELDPGLISRVMAPHEAQRGQERGARAARGDEALPLGASAREDG